MYYGMFPSLKKLFHTKTYFKMKKSLFLLACLCCLFSCKKETVTNELPQIPQLSEASDRSTCNCAINVTDIIPDNGAISVVEVTAGGETYRWNDHCFFIYGGTPQPFYAVEGLNTWYSFPAPTGSPIDVKLKFIACLSSDGCFGGNTNGTLTYKLRCSGGKYASENSTITNSFIFTGAEQTHQYITSLSDCAPSQIFSE